MNDIIQAAQSLSVKQTVQRPIAAKSTTQTVEKKQILLPNSKIITFRAKLVGNNRLEYYNYANDINEQDYIYVMLSDKYKANLEVRPTATIKSFDDTGFWFKSTNVRFESITGEYRLISDCVQKNVKVKATIHITEKGVFIRVLKIIV